MPKPTILITGGTSGIGLATANLMHRRGYQVIATGSSADSVAAARRALPGDVLLRSVDARSIVETARAIAEIGERFGTLNAVFLNAGISRPQPVAEVDQATFDDLVGVNFKGQFFTLQQALPLLVDGGSIVITVGIGVTRGIPGGTITSATRGALLSLMPSLALELAPRRIRVNAVSPGAVHTPMWDKLGVGTDAREQVSARIPFGRFGVADEIAETVAFLVSDGAGYITGQNIVVAGGSGLGS